MTQDLFMHGLGVASFAVIAGAGALSAATFVMEIGGKWDRIVAALRGEPAFPHGDPIAANDTGSFVPDSSTRRGAA